MQNRILLSLFALSLSFSCFSQNKFEIGVEAAVTSDHYEINDPKNNLITVPCINGGGGISFRMNGNKNFFYEAGLFLKATTFGYKYKYETGYGNSEGENLLSIPLRAGYYLHFSRKVMISPLLGVAPSFRTSFADASSETLYTQAGTTVHTTDQERDLHKNFSLLLQGGIALDFIIAKVIRLSVNPNYYHGTSNIFAYDVHYTISNVVGTMNSDAEITGKGSFFSWNVGVRYMLRQKRQR
jgi:hypothetical protein